jgi:AcrR family transcriptional regulator
VPAATGPDRPGKPKRRYARRMSPEDRREQLLDAALAVLSRDGYTGLSIEAIAREADVTRPVVYGAYDGLDPLLVALLDRTQTRALERLLEVLDAAGPPHDVDAWLARVATSAMDAVRAEPEVWRPILGMVPGAPSLVLDRIAGTREVVRQHVVAALSTGLLNRPRAGLDSELLGHLVIATAEEFGRLLLSDPPPYSQERILAGLRGLVALLAAPPHPSE